MNTKMEGRASAKELGAIPDMELTAFRQRNNGDTTIGELLIDGGKVCDTLEDEPRAQKVHGETRIEAGRYEVTLRTVGGFNDRYQSYYKQREHIFGKDWHKGMLWVRNVPNFEYILIHCGNTDEDTAGCLLVGTAQKGAWTISNSRKAYEKIYPRIAAHLLKGGKVFINYIDNDKGFEQLA